jgi:hypothetical protein
VDCQCFRWDGAETKNWTLLVSVVFCDRYLVDPASSYMLVLKIKPCMSKHMP